MRFKSFAGLLTAFLGMSASYSQAAADHLLITKVMFDCPNPENAAGSSEFIEIYNPTNQPVALDKYFVTDLNGTDAANPHKYYHYPELDGANAVAFFADYLNQFPPGYTLQPKKTAVVTQSARLFLLKYFSGMPSQTTDIEVSNQLAALDVDQCLQRFYQVSTAQLLFEVSDASNTYPFAQQIPAVPKMIQRAPNQTTPADEASNRGWLLNMTNGGEFVALTYWDGGKTPMKDVDVVAWGAPAANGQDAFPKKTGVTVFTGTPDEYAYKADNGSGAVGGNLLATTATSGGLGRIDFTEGAEAKTDGNGITGNDESTEDAANTFKRLTHPEVSWSDTTPAENPPGLVNEPPSAGGIVGAERSVKNPTPGQPVTLTASINGANLLTSAKFIVSTVHPTASGPTAFDITFANPNASPAEGTAAIGSYPEGTVIQWHVETMDSSSNAGRFPTVGEKSFMVTAAPVYPNDIVINEILYDPFGTDNGSGDSGGSEWIELYNRTNQEIDLSFSPWTLVKTTNVVNNYVFPANTKIAANGYLIMAAQRTRFMNLYSSLAIPEEKVVHFTPYTDITATLMSSGDTINIMHINDYQWQNTVSPVVLDTVQYFSTGNGWPGKSPSSSGQPGASTYDPTNPNNGGPTIELVNPNLDNNVGESWLVCVAALIQNENPPLNPRGGTPAAQNSVFSNADVNLWQLY